MKEVIRAPGKSATTTVASNPTPGPWLCGADDPFVYALNDGGTNRFFAGVQGGWETHDTPADKRTSREELLANARLIAAAPELLALLKEAAADIAQFEGEHDAPRYGSLSERIAAVIAKATGETA